METEDVEALYRRYGPIVLRRARALLRHDQAAADAMQEVFIRVLRSYREFRREASPVTWLYRITTNYCLNVLRDNARREKKLGERKPLDPSDQGAVPEQRLAIAQLLDRVPRELCEIAVYFYVDRMSHEEIAQTLGTSRRTIGNRLKEFHHQAQFLVAFPTEVVA
jgi:RNA polymerase sigma-70 factor (ECF subfamily)